MADKPITFSAPMVNALLSGRKTQTRRALPLAHPRFPECSALSLDVLNDPQQVWYWDGIHDRAGASYRLPYAPGDRLYVREAWAPLDACKHNDPGAIALTNRGFYRADHADGLPNDIQRWSPSIHMPRWASRLTLIVTDVRVQRLQDISTDDAASEGVSIPWTPGGSLALMAQGVAKNAFRDLWNSLHGPDAWDANPWVVALSFDVQRGNIDQIGSMK